jgi:hypothetical protein
MINENGFGSKYVNVPANITIIIIIIIIIIRFFVSSRVDSTAQRLIRK